MIYRRILSAIDDGVLHLVLTNRHRFSSQPLATRSS